METLSPEKQIVLIRLLCVFVPLTVAYVLICMQRVTYRHLTGIYLASLWCFLVLLFLNPLIIHFGGWSYNVHLYTYHQAPVDLVIGWAIFWGAIPHLSRTPLPVWAWVLLLFGLDLALMPHLGSIVTLHPEWMLWELVCLALAFVPSWYLARWTKDRKFLYVRSFMQMILFILIFSVLIPLVIIEKARIRILPVEGVHPLFQPHWSVLPWSALLPIFAILLFSLVMGLSALQEFALRGKGTPFPLDPPLKLVTTGPYAYVSNPMQTSQILFYFFLAMFLGSSVFYVAAIMTWIFCRYYAKWVESGQLLKRFDRRWKLYDIWLRPYFPFWKPWRKKPAKIYLDLYGCVACSNLGRVLLFLKPTLLIIKDARYYPSEDLMRMAYKDVDGYEARGVHALGRALEHINLMWALVGSTVRLPVISHISQWIIDAAFPPHRVCRVPDVEDNLA